MELHPGEHKRDLYPVAWPLYFRDDGEKHGRDEQIGQN